MKLNFLQIAIEKGRENLYNKKEEYFKNEKRNILCCEISENRNPAAGRVKRHREVLWQIRQLLFWRQEWGQE